MKYLYFFSKILSVNLTEDQLVELDAETLDVVGVTELELPHEYMSRVDYNDYGNYLFETDLTDDGVLVMYPDVFSETQLREQEERSLILALYDRRTGDMTWRARLLLDVEYDVYGVKIGHVNQ